MPTTIPTTTNPEWLYQNDPIFRSLVSATVDAIDHQDITPFNVIRAAEFACELAREREILKGEES